RYEAGEPDLAWLAYRYLGDPGRGLPEIPKSPIAWGHGEEEGRPVFRVFDDKAQLNLDIFGFAMADVLLRAAKRRIIYGRAQVSLTDMMLGLVRKGELTRLALRRLGVEPDDLYEAFASDGFRSWEHLHHEERFEASGEGIEAIVRSIADISDAPEQDRGEVEAKLQTLISRFIVRDEAEFSPALVELLIDADAQAQRHGSPATEAAICEGDLLRALLERGAWIDISQDYGGYLAKELPEGSDMQRVLGEIEREGQVDRNGDVRLTGLSAPALQIIEIAHHLAEQRGASQITNRLLLAAFLIEDHGHPAELCRRAGVDPKKICAAMMALTPAGPSQAFPLSLE